MHANWTSLLIVILSLASLGACGRNESKQYDHNFLDGLLTFSPAFQMDGDNLSRQCKLDAQEFMRDLRQLKYWAFQMYDSTGKPNSGLLNGNINTYGDYEQCLSIPHPRIGGKYCLLGIDADFHSSSSYQGPIKPLLNSAYLDYAFFGPDHNAPVGSTRSVIKFVWGFCIPSSCSLQDLMSTLDHILAPFNSTENGLKIGVTQFDDSCTTEISKNFPVRSYFTIFLLIVIFTLPIVGAIYDYLKLSPSGALVDVQNLSIPEKIVLAFSLKRTIPILKEMKRKNDGSEITCVDGIRLTFALLLFVTHRVFFLWFYPMTNRTTMMRQVVEQPYTMLFRVVLNNVDTFVVISGLLSSFHGLRLLQSGGKLNIPVMYLKRYVKFTPLFIIIALVVRDVGPYILRNPHNINLLDKCAESCENIWKPLTYTGNLFDDFSTLCYPASHQIVTDMQLYLLAPFLIMFLWRFRAVAVSVLSAVVVAISLYSGWVVYKKKLAVVLYHGVTFSIGMESLSNIYLNTFLRLPPYLIGFLLGYVLHFSTINPIKLSKPVQIIGHAVFSIAAYYSYFWLSHSVVPGYRYDALEMAVFKVVQPMLLCGAVSWLIFICHMGYAAPLNKMLSQRPFIIFSRVSYSFYMVQTGVMAFIHHIHRVPMYSDFLNVIDISLIAVTIVATISTTINVCIPTTLLEKYLLQTTPGKRRTSNDEVSGKQNSGGIFTIEKMVDKTRL